MNHIDSLIHIDPFTLISFNSIHFTLLFIFFVYGNFSTNLDTGYLLIDFLDVLVVVLILETDSSKSYG
jgi:hypothetical protein